ncbi:protein FAM200C-like [Lepeophtheirus salmonis]|uniref:protein FAM200C-like n=1 Tax=Lepeophtheirus salmonis TaxID=72036 RepID=UPI001AE8E807|nr:protein ZBED8-like [Lepeophtheirus salmonis]
MVSAVCSDGASTMLGRHSDFEALVNSNVPDIIITLCVLHRHWLATQTLPLKVAQVLKVVVECVKYVRSSAMNHCIFKELCKEMYLGIRGTSVELKQVIAIHLEDLTKFIEGYFHTPGSYAPWVRQSFTFSVATANVNDEYLDEIIELPQNQLQRQHFRTKTLSTFWCQEIVSYPLIVRKALDILIPFVTRYIFFVEKSLSRMVYIKTKKMNILVCENEMRVGLAKVKPRFSELVSEKEQKRHINFQLIFNDIVFS